MPTTPSVRMVVFVAGADDWKPDGARENVYGCLQGEIGADGLLPIEIPLAAGVDAVTVTNRRPIIGAAQVSP